MLDSGRLAVVYCACAPDFELANAQGANVERQKVVWPNRREAMMVTLMVIILVIIIGLFIALVDKILFETIYNLILGVKD